MSRHFSGELYGRLMGLQYAMLALAIAGGAALMGLLREVTGSYAASWIGAAIVFILSTPPVFLARSD